MSRVSIGGTRTNIHIEKIQEQLEGRARRSSAKIGSPKPQLDLERGIDPSLEYGNMVE